VIFSSLKDWCVLALLAGLTPGLVPLTDRRWVVKLADFGLTTLLVDGEAGPVGCGYSDFGRPPEILEGR
jgi:hypothetical protein